MDRIEKTIILMAILGLSLIWIVACSDVPYTRPFMSIDDVLSSAGDDTICLDDGFDAVCIKAIPGQDGKDGRDGVDGKNGRDGVDGKNGQTLIAVREVRIEVIVEKIIETIVVEEVVREVPVEVIVDRVVTEYVDREVPIEVFVERTVEIIKEVVVEKEVFVEVPVEVIVEKVVEIPVEVPVTVTKTVVVYQTPPETPPVIVENKIYDSQDYLNWVNNGKSAGQHEHTFWHTHNGKRHGHRIAHPDGQTDNWEREHDGYGGVSHE